MSTATNVLEMISLAVESSRQGVSSLRSDAAAGCFERVMDMQTLAVQRAISEDDIALKCNTNRLSSARRGNVRGKKSNVDVVV